MNQYERNADFVYEFLDHVAAQNLNNCLPENKGISKRFQALFQEYAVRLGTGPRMTYGEWPDTMSLSSLRKIIERETIREGDLKDYEIQGTQHFFALIKEMKNLSPVGGLCDLFRKDVSQMRLCQFNLESDRKCQSALSSLLASQLVQMESSRSELILKQIIDYSMLQEERRCIRNNSQPLYPIGWMKDFVSAAAMALRLFSVGTYPIDGTIWTAHRTYFPQALPMVPIRHYFRGKFFPKWLGMFFESLTPAQEDVYFKSSVAEVWRAMEICLSEMNFMDKEIDYLKNLFFESHSLWQQDDETLAPLLAKKTKVDLINEYACLQSGQVNQDLLVFNELIKEAYNNWQQTVLDILTPLQSYLWSATPEALIFDLRTMHRYPDGTLIHLLSIEIPTMLRIYFHNICDPEKETINLLIANPDILEPWF